MVHIYVWFDTAIDVWITGPVPDEVINSGAQVILQCHIFRATGPVTYNWTREDGQTLPVNSFLDNNGIAISHDIISIPFLLWSLHTLEHK